MYKYLLIILLVCLLVSCAGMPASGVSPAPRAVSSEAHTSTATLKPAPTPPPTLSPSPTLDPYTDSIDSPDGKFTVKMHINWTDPNEKPFIEIWEKSGKALWRVAYQYHWDPYVAPNDSLRIYGWSKDSSKVYFYYSFAYDGWYTLFNGSNLQSLDAYTGDVKDVIAGCCIAFAFSPDMDEVAYTANGEVGILDLTTGVDKSVSILPDRYEQSGWIHISPSGEKVVFHTLYEYDGTAVLLDTRTMQQSVIIDKFFIESLQFDGWTVDEDPRYMEFGKDVFILDLQTTSRITIGTPTTQP